MEKRPFWARVNRGVVAAAALAALVTAYCLGVYAFKQPQYAAVRALCTSVKTLAVKQLTLTQEEADALVREQDAPARLAALAAELKGSFVKDSEYLPGAASGLDGLLGSMRLASSTPKKEKVTAKSLSEDTAKMDVTYTYNDPESDDGSSRIELRISMVCKRQNGEWKIFRLSELSVYNISEGGNSSYSVVIGKAGAA